MYDIYTFCENILFFLLCLCLSQKLHWQCSCVSVSQPHEGVKEFLLFQCYVQNSSIYVNLLFSCFTRDNKSFNNTVKILTLCNALSIQMSKAKGKKAPLIHRNKKKNKKTNTSVRHFLLGLLTQPTIKLGKLFLHKQDALSMISFQNKTNIWTMQLQKGVRQWFSKILNSWESIVAFILCMFNNQQLKEIIRSIKIFLHTIVCKDIKHHTVH